MFFNVLKLNSNFEGSFAYSYAPSFSGLIAYFFLASIIAGVLCWLPVAFAPKKNVYDKNSSYECGFEPFFNNNSRHEIHFIVVSILFVIFDLEIVLLVPMVASATNAGFVGFELQLIFAYILVIGLIYEWFTGALSWPVFHWNTKNVANGQD